MSRAEVRRSRLASGSLLILAGLLLNAACGTGPKSQEELAREAESRALYHWVAGTMSFETFHGIREKNRKEREQFGGGSSDLTYPGHRNSWNGHYTLVRGVWVNDAMPRPTNKEIDAFREAARRSKEATR